MTTYQQWNFYFQIFQFLATAAVGFYTWWSNREKVTGDRFSVLEDRMTKVEIQVKNTIDNLPKWDGLEKRLVSIEAALKTPRQCGNHERMEDNDIKLFKRFDELHGDIREQIGALKGLTRSVDMINEYLLKERK